MRLLQLLEDMGMSSRDRVNHIVDMLSGKDTNGWKFKATSNFKNGFKKHKTDPRVMQAFEELLNFIVSQDKIPQMADYPHHLNMHIIVNHPIPEYKRSTWGHLKGQVVGVIFRIDEPGEVKLLNMGTHKEAGLGK